MTAYYNEWDAQAAAWLRELIKQGHIADGVVDERDIKEVEPADLQEFTQCHFFAGIGGWSAALRIAGWDDERPVWTGSPPCQPFSVAGRGKGIDDDRHIAPIWLDLVKECRPPVLFGEQVAAATSKDGWLDALQDALENEGYATGAAVLPACSVNAPHIRQRLWFTARLENPSSIGRCGRRERHYEAEGNRPNAEAEVAGSSTFGGLADTASQRSQGCSRSSQARGFGCPSSSSASGLGNTHQPRLEGHTWEDNETEGRAQSDRSAAETGVSGGLADATSQRLEKQVLQRRHCVVELQEGLLPNDRPLFNARQPSGHAPETQWGSPDWLFCRDGKWRPVESSTFPLAHGIPARVGRLRGYGNAIVPQVAAEVVQVMMEDDV